jgi:hypothetical protein
MRPPKKDPPSVAEKPVTGRIGQDDRGNATWEYKKLDGSYTRDLNSTGVHRALESDELSLEETAKHRSLGPVLHEKEQGTTKRRTLDDMRKLSEAIKKSKEGK